MFGWFEKPKQYTKTKTLMLSNIEESLVPIYLANSMMAKFDDNETIEAYVSSVSTLITQSTILLRHIKELEELDFKRLDVLSNELPKEFGLDKVMNYYKKRVKSLEVDVRVLEDLKENKIMISNPQPIQSFEIKRRLIRIETVGKDILDISNKVSAIK